MFKISSVVSIKVLLLLCCAASVMPASATKFDVKTSIMKKGGEMTAFKSTIIAFLKLKGHDVVEFKEDYSLFIQEFEVIPDKNNVKVHVVAEIQKPSLFGKGKTIETITIDKIYDTKKLSNPKTWTLEDKAKFEEMDAKSSKSFGLGSLGTKVCEIAGNVYSGAGTLTKNLLSSMGIEVDSGVSSHINFGSFLAGTDVVNNVLKFLIKKDK